MAVFLTAERGKHDWASADVHDVEAFLATCPVGRPKHLTALRQFFTWAKASKLVLTDPARGLSARQPRGYHGPTVPLEFQRRLFRRWTTGVVHPHEAPTGLLTLIHGAGNQELCGLTIGDVGPGTCSIRLGRRPHPSPSRWTLPPGPPSSDASATARSPGPRTRFLLVTRKTKATRVPASDDYARNLLRSAGVTPRLLRCTRLAELTNDTDPKLVSAAFGIHPQAATHYLTDHVDAGRWPEPDGDATAHDCPYRQPVGGRGDREAYPQRGEQDGAMRRARAGSELPGLECAALTYASIRVSYTRVGERLVDSAWPARAAAQLRV
jgi:hypothetical protein